MYELLQNLLKTDYFEDEVTINNSEIKMKFNLVRINKHDVWDNNVAIPYNYFENIIKIIGDKQYFLNHKSYGIFLLIKNEPKTIIV